MGRKTVSRKYGIFSALILATSLEFLILAKFAILDIVVATCIGFSLYFGMMVYFCKENYKKYFWWLFYIFSGLAVMAKGIPGFAVPFGSMFFISIVSKKFKEIFKPAYFVVGFVLFFLITIPWHALMLKTYNPLFWNEYIIKHHLARFLGTEGVIGRTQPFYFYFLTVLWGFFPWIISCLVVWIKNLIQVIKKKEYKFNFESLNNSQRFMLYNAIAFVFTLLFFSSSETKLITYILPLYLPLACLGAYIWYDYAEKSINDKLINITVYVIGGIFVFASIAAIFTPLFLPQQLSDDISDAKLLVILLLFAVGLASILFAKKKLYYGVFITYVVFMAILSGFGTEKFYKVDYKFGQDDLLKYAEYSKTVNKDIATYQFSHKYSLIYYGEKHIFYGLDLKPNDIKKVVKDGKLLIIPHKKMRVNKEGFCEINKELKAWIDKHTIMDGRKYVLIGDKG